MGRIYTRTGDAGETSLFGGRRVPKDDLRVEAYGTVDELGSFLGLARAHLEQDRDVAEVLLEIQRELFALGAELASPGPPMEATKPTGVTADRVKWLEETIDRFHAELPPLQLFVLAGGPGALLHVARTVARRAERRIVALHRREPLNPELLRYINRLSDLLFVLARVVNHRHGETEVVWERRREHR
ncbi:MAG: cob(I)yrinic acid a,c-diamide adenosyltransferase [Armatimonadota bacterium]|nr:cob(I)yrinic acid a,c-diamide adenosyltransferase [Armatimonadota bacterium]MDR5703188.1 cob(I)yrinic acid a,c-diamide adenosyltransferase [Armatimonadota bacterium]MDR7434760.1 cob(I)yrinic acid a,c-diamide adenosyltransferase [Armatimonadota bacterium]